MFSSILSTTIFPDVEILWKDTVSVEFRAIRPKLCGNCTFPQNCSRQEVRWNFGVLSSDISFFDQKYPPSNNINWDGINHNQKQPSRGVPRNRCSENKQQIYRRAPMPKCDFTLRHRCSPVNFQHIFRTPFPKNTSGWLLLYNNDIVSWLKD